MARLSNPQNFRGQKLVSKQELGLGENDVIVETIVDPNIPEDQPEHKRQQIVSGLMPTLKFQGQTLGALSNSINIIGVGNVSVDENGNITLRLGENLNSSLFNNTDGTTTGTASHSGASISSVIVKNTGVKESVWKKDSTNQITATTAGKIHFNADGAEAFKLTVIGTEVTSTYVFGAITKAGYYAPAVYEEVKDEKGNIISTNITTDSAISTTAPSTAAYLSITGWQKESNEDKGATGYQANMSIIFDIAKIVEKDGSVKFNIEPLGMGAEAKTYGEKVVCYYLTDTALKPTISSFTAALTSASTVTYGGVTSLKSGTVTYTAKVADLNNPATDASNGASIQIDNTQNYAGDIAKAAQTTYDGTITQTANMTVSNTGSTYSSTHLSSGVKFIAWNINGPTELTAALTDSDGKAITAIDHYSGTPDASITTNRISLDSTDGNKISFDNAAAPGDNDLMIYHGLVGIPVTTDFSTYYGNSDTYKVPSKTERSILVHLPIAGTKAEPTLTISGSNLTTGVIGIYVSGKLSTLDKDSALILGTAGGIKNGNAADNNSATSRTIKLTYLGAGKAALTEASGAYIKIVLSSSSTAKIKSIAIG